MVPLLAGMAVAGAGSLLKNAPDLLPSAFKRDQRQRRDELQRREELGMLGLTEQERNVLEGRLAGRSQAASEKANADRQRYLAAQGAFGGQALQQATLMDEARAAQEVAIQQSIEEQDLAEKLRETDELRGLEAATEENRQRAIGALTGAGASMLEAGITGSALSADMQGRKEPSQQSINLLMNEYNLSKEEARGWLELGSVRPELMQYYNLLGGDSR